jgi:hypothetical protein
MSVQDSLDVQAWTASVQAEHDQSAKEAYQHFFMKETSRSSPKSSRARSGRGAFTSSVRPNLRAQQQLSPKKQIKRNSSKKAAVKNTTRPRQSASRHRQRSTAVGMPTPSAASPKRRGWGQRIASASGARRSSPLRRATAASPSSSATNAALCRSLNRSLDAKHGHTTDASAMSLSVMGITRTSQEAPLRIGTSSPPSDPSSSSSSLVVQSHSDPVPLEAKTLDMGVDDSKAASRRTTGYEHWLGYDQTDLELTNDDLTAAISQINAAADQTESKLSEMKRRTEQFAHLTSNLNRQPPPNPYASARPSPLQVNVEVGVGSEDEEDEYDSDDFESEGKLEETHVPSTRRRRRQLQKSLDAGAMQQQLAQAVSSSARPGQLRKTMDAGAMKQLMTRGQLDHAYRELLRSRAEIESRVEQQGRDVRRRPKSAVAGKHRASVSSPSRASQASHPLSFPLMEQPEAVVAAVKSGTRELEMARQHYLAHLARRVWHAMRRAHKRKLEKRAQLLAVQWKRDEVKADRFALAMRMRRYLNRWRMQFSVSQQNAALAAQRTTRLSKVELLLQRKAAKKKQLAATAAAAADGAADGAAGDGGGAVAQGRDRSAQGDDKQRRNGDAKSKREWNSTSRKKKPRSEADKAKSARRARLEDKQRLESEEKRRVLLEQYQKRKAAQQEDRERAEREAKEKEAARVVEEKRRRREEHLAIKRRQLEKEVRVRLRKEKNQLAEMHYVRSVLINHGWRPWCRLVESRRLRAKEVDTFAAYKCLARTFKQWRTNAVRIRRQIQGMRNRSCVSGALSAWKRYVFQTKMDMSTFAFRHYAARNCGHCFHAWKLYARGEHLRRLARLRELEVVCTRKGEVSLLRFWFRRLSERCDASHTERLVQQDVYATKSKVSSWLKDFRANKGRSDFSATTKGQITLADAVPRVPHRQLYRPLPKHADERKKDLSIVDSLGGWVIEPSELDSSLFTRDLDGNLLSSPREEDDADTRDSPVRIPYR